MSLKSFDFFRKLNTDSETNSVIGGILTFIAFIVYGFIDFKLVSVLLYNETSLYMTKTITYTAVIDNDTEQFIHIHIDITVKAPCRALSLDQQDEVGVHRLDVQDTLKKLNINKDGKTMKDYEEEQPNYYGSQREVDDLIEAINQNEYCRFIGYVKANKVPGNFHISYHAKPQLLQRLYQRDLNVYKKMKLDHIVNNLSFGDEVNPQNLLQGYPIEFQQYFKPFRIINKSSPQNNDNLKNDYEYHVKALPARFVDRKSHQSKTLYKFSMTQAEATKSASEMDSIYFRYQISPINMLYDIEGRSFYHFLVQLCAIIGGVFAVLGMLNSVLQSLV